MSAYVLWLLSYCIATGVRAYTTQPGGRFHNVTKGLEDASDVLACAAQLGLRATEHAVVTEDGYVLRVFRVRGAGTGTETETGQPVLLMHGLLLSSAVWLDAGGAALATLLAASRRDLWLGNARGSYYSRRHAWRNPDTDALFWRFSADEIGRYDLPALLDYILTATGFAKLDYIGHSQGGGTFFMMCSERPDYCQKVNVMIALAPATRMLHTKSTLFRLFTEYWQNNENELYKRGIWEAFPRGGAVQSFVQNFCEWSEVSTEVCLAFLSVLDGSNPQSIARSTFLAAIATIPAGTSVHNMAWFGQHVKSSRFHKFDYGPEQNLVQYESETAPAYNLSAVTIPTVVMYGRNDGIVDPRDVRWLVRKLPNVKKVFEIEDPLWSHFDFVLSRYIPKLLYPKIEETLSRYNR